MRPPPSAWASRRASAATAAAWPLRTAPSIVAGQPVSVQAPARNRPFMCVRGPGRSRPAPGAARKVAAFSRVTSKRSMRASRGAGSRRPARHQAPRSSPCSRHIRLGARQRHRKVLAARQARATPCGRRPTAPAVDRGRERHVEHVAVVQRRAGSRSASCPARTGWLRALGQQPRRAPCGARRGTATSASSALGTLRPSTARRPGGRARCASARARTPRRRRAAARSAASPCRCESGTRGAANVAGGAAREEPGPEHLAACASDASPAGEVERGQRDQVPQRVDRRGALPVRGQPVAEALLVGGAGRRGRPAEREPTRRRASRSAGADGVGSQRAREVQRRRQAVAAQPRAGAAGRHHRDVRAAPAARVAGSAPRRSRSAR